MTGTLSIPERRIGLSLAVLLALMGLVMAASARHGVMSVHGFMALGLMWRTYDANGSLLYSFLQSV